MLGEGDEHGEKGPLRGIMFNTLLLGLHDGKEVIVRQTPTVRPEMLINCPRNFPPFSQESLRTEPIDF